MRHMLLPLRPKQMKRGKHYLEWGRDGSHGAGGAPFDRRDTNRGGSLRPGLAAAGVSLGLGSDM